MALAEPDSNPGFLQVLFIDLFSGAGGLHLVLKTLNPEPLTHPFANFPHCHPPRKTLLRPDDDTRPQKLAGFSQDRPCHARRFA